MSNNILNNINEDTLKFKIKEELAKTFYNIKENDGKIKVISTLKTELDEIIEVY